MSNDYIRIGVSLAFVLCSTHVILKLITSTVIPAIVRRDKNIVFNIMSKNKKLYNDMRHAIERNDHQSMSKIIRDRDYQPNYTGEGEERMTALHTATLKEDPEALSILLQLEKIDPNAKLSNGFTPLLLAAARGRMISFEVLIGDKRVDVNATDNENQTATDLVKAHGKLIVAKRAKELLARRTSISEAVLTSTKIPEVETFS